MKHTGLQWKMLLLTALLSACAGATGGGVAGPPGGGLGSGSGSELNNSSTASNVGGKTTFTTAQATGEGTVSSQSANVDITQEFIREYSIAFQGYDGDISGPSFDYILPSNPGSFPKGTVRKIQNGLDGYKEPACTACQGSWLRVLDCCPYSDADIEKLMPDEGKGQVLGSNPLLWFLSSMPRLSGNTAVTTCEGGKYWDFPIEAGGAVDLSAMDISANEILVFYLVDANPGQELGPLSANGFMQIPKEAIAATASKHGILRYSRPLASLKLSPQIIQAFPVQ